MTRVSLWMLQIGLFITVGLICVKPRHPASSEENRPAQDEDTLTCTLETLKGRYLFGSIATLLPPAAPQQSLLALAGYHLFNGDGTGTDIVTVTINGTLVQENAEFDISYTVNPNCTGTFTVPQPDSPSGSLSRLMVRSWSSSGRPQALY
jgi:hypothetical protein